MGGARKAARTAAISGGNAQAAALYGHAELQRSTTFRVSAWSMPIGTFATGKSLSTAAPEHECRRRSQASAIRATPAAPPLRRVDLIRSRSPMIARWILVARVAPNASQEPSSVE